MNTKIADEEIGELIDLLECHVPHPALSDLIFYDKRELTAQEILQEALSYSNIFLNSKDIKN